MGFVTFNGKNGLAEIIDFSLDTDPNSDKDDVALLRIKELEGFSNINELNIPYIHLATRDHKVDIGDKTLRIGYPGARNICHFTECNLLSVENNKFVTDDKAFRGESGGGLIHTYHKGFLIPFTLQIGVTQTAGTFEDSKKSLFLGTGYGNLQEIHDMLDKNGIKLDYLVKIILIFS